MKREKIDQMSSEVVDSNPYSRLMALERMGIVDNYQSIRDFTVVIVGIGGVGSTAAEMLCRCGIGKLIMFDYDTVELANMNRLFFRPDQTGMKKTDAAIDTLMMINPDVVYESYPYNITSVKEYQKFQEVLLSGSLSGGKVDLVLGCVDNFQARITVNRACMEHNIVWMESGVSEDAMNGHIQMILPGRTACFECAPPLIVARGGNEKELKREGVCAASLPTTMSIVSSFLIQNALKYLLGFGELSYYLGYNGMKNFFQNYEMKPNDSCSNPHCITRQTEVANEPTPEPTPAEPELSPILHEDNTWGITLISESDQTPTDTPTELPEGLTYSYTPQTQQPTEQTSADPTSSLQDLRSRLKTLQSQ
eukprot:TRINITY_DN1987_c0_g1_i1.p1 TRINITY_DN1987_c0_g1~~TRINITY_DN1987_c0_g1_i1.p1  ORF type:complete len:365 (-),score=69.79 TRINITY_DN1987_c0_g1_i1:32-1126(-)